MKIHKYFEIPRFGDDSFFLKFFLSFSVLSVISAAMLFLGDKISKKDMVLTRYMATFQAPLSGQFYPSIGREDITVLLYDDVTNICEPLITLLNIWYEPLFN